MAPILFLVLLMAPLLPLRSDAQSLQLHFYKNSCPKAEAIVKMITRRRFAIDPSLPAGLLRLHFHDCFVHGCDASVLIDSTDENIAEKEASPNQTLRGFEIIDEIKAELEKQCKGVVSCADILALAARDGVSFAGGSAYGVPTGRRDGQISNLFNVHIPGPSFSLSNVVQLFEAINLDINDLTTLLGSHSIGFSHCGFLVDRLYNHKGSGRPDPNMDQGLVNSLTKTCPRTISQNLSASTDPKVFLVPKSQTPFVLDNSFYKALLDGEVALDLDQQLAFTSVTQKIASNYLNRPKVFRRKFAKAMIKLGNVGVLTGQQGEIRQHCRRFNKLNQ